jgi:hypothetical protein
VFHKNIVFLRINNLGLVFVKTKFLQSYSIAIQQDRQNGSGSKEIVAQGSLRVSFLSVFVSTKPARYTHSEQNLLH